MQWFFVLSVITSAAISLAKPIAPRWDDMKVKHSWDTIPDIWEHHGHPPDGATIDLRIALKPHRENTLIETLYEVSDPKHPKCVPSRRIPVRIYSHSRAYRLSTQIWCAPIQGAGRRTRRSPSGHNRTRRLLAGAPRCAYLFGLIHARRWLVDTLWSAPGPSRRPSRRIVPTLPPHPNERDGSSHDWLLVALRPSRARQDRRADDILWLSDSSPADLATGPGPSDASQG
jgi:hypothetical protein